MKKYLMILLIGLIGLSLSCGQPQYAPQQYQQEVWTSPSGQRVVYVDNGSTQFVMDYMLFNSLYNAGGYSRVYGYYRTNPTIYSVNHYYNYNRPSSSRYYNTNYYRSSPNYRPLPPRSNYRASTPSLYKSSPQSSFRSSPPSSRSYRPSSPSFGRRR